MESMIITIAKELHLSLYASCRTECSGQIKNVTLEGDQQNKHSRTPIPLLPTQQLPEDQDVHQSLTVAEAASMVWTRPIEIPSPGHWRARKMSEDRYRVAPHLYTKEGIKIETEPNQFGEFVPRVPLIARPCNKMRDITSSPGSSRWNAITASWIDSDHESSRGSWGRFKDERRLNRQEVVDDDDDDGGEVKGLFLSNTSSARSEQEKCHMSKPQWRMSPLQTQPADSELCKVSRLAASRRFDLRELARLAAENEDAIESY